MKLSNVVLHSTVLALIVVASLSMAQAARGEALANAPFNVCLPFVGRNLISGPVPTLLAPANGATVNTIRPTYEWDNGQDARATGCALRVAEDAGFQNIVLARDYFQGRGVQRTRPTEALQPATIYFWRVRLVYATQTGPWSEVWSFTTGQGTVPAAPTLVAPANGATLHSLPITLQWQAVAGATYYEIALGKQSEGYFGYGAITSDTQYQLPWQLDPTTVYEWEIRAGNDFGPGPWSVVWRFTTPAP